MNKEVWVCNGQEFSVGDSVRVARFVANHDRDGMGDGIEWQNVWMDGEMDKAIGGEFVIAEIIGDDGVLLENFVDDTNPHPHFDYAYPLSALDRIAG